MSKIELFSRIQKLATIVHNSDVMSFNISDESLQDLRNALDNLTNEYIARYCNS